MNLVDVAALLEVLNKHGCYMSDQNSQTILDRTFSMDDKYDTADLALRTCMCGAYIDGFDEYLNHLAEVIKTLSSTT